MSRFIAVISGWFMDSHGSEAIALDGVKTLEQAELVGAKIAHDRRSTFQRTDYFIVEIDKAERLVRRRLSWRERLTGWVNPAQGGE